MMNWDGTAAEHFVRSLQRHDVDTLFGQSLPSAIVLAAEKIGIRQIAYRQENAGGAMADGFARASGKVGFVLAQNGPAATLLVPPLAEALKASVPIIALVQEVERDQVNRNAFQELDHFALFSGVAKYIRRVDDPARIDDYLDGAIIAATSGRPGPAVLLLPADVLRGPYVTSQFPRAASYGKWPLDRVRPSNEAVMAAAQLIASSRSAVIIAGGGVLSAGASLSLAEVSDLASLPVFTTNMGKGAMNEFAPLACGVTGALNGRRSIGSSTREILSDADTVLLVGTRTNQNGTDSWKILPKSARYIHIDVDAGEVGRTYEAMRLVGDARETLLALRDALSTCDLAVRTEKRAAIESKIRTAWAQFEDDRRIYAGSNVSPIRPERVMAELQPLLTEETTVVADASYSSMWIVGQLRNAFPGSRFLTPRGLAGLGWGFPMALGVAVAKPGKPVVAVVGDGGFGHNWSELETAVRHQIPVVTILLNNGILGFQKDAETAKFGAYTTACHFSPVDHAMVARACGCRAIRVEATADLRHAMQEALASKRPWLIEVLADPAAHPALSLFADTLDRVGPAQ